VGREREIVALEQRLKEASQGHGGIVLLAGEPGIGKTRLLLELAEVARDQGWLVLIGHAYDSEGMPPYLPFVEAISGLVLLTPDETLHSKLAGAALRSRCSYRRCEVAVQHPDRDHR
jgi:predicted ATPase